MAQIANNEGPERFTFEANLDVAGVQALFDALQAICESKPRQVVFDASKLERADTAVFQAVVVVARKLRDGAVPFEWRGCGANIINSANLLGLAEALGINSGNS